MPIRKLCHFLADGFEIAILTRVNNISDKPMAVFTLSYPLSQATCCKPQKQVFMLRIHRSPIINHSFNNWTSLLSSNQIFPPAHVVDFSKTKLNIFHQEYMFSSIFALLVNHDSLYTICQGRMHSFTISY